MVTVCVAPAASAPFVHDGVNTVPSPEVMERPLTVSIPVPVFRIVNIASFEEPTETFPNARFPSTPMIRVAAAGCGAGVGEGTGAGAVGDEPPPQPTMRTVDAITAASRNNAVFVTTGILHPARTEKLGEAFTRRPLVLLC